MISEHESMPLPADQGCTDYQLGRRHALEEAAIVCEALRKEYGPSLSPYTTGARLGADKCARRIRALIKEQK